MRQTLSKVVMAGVVALMLLGLISSTAAWGQPASAPEKAAPLLGEGKGQVVLTWDEFVKITGYDPTKKGQQVLTVPWAEVEKLLGVQVKGAIPQGATMVDLPWKDFQALLEWSVKKKGDTEAPPPTDYIVSSSVYEGALTNDQANFTLKLKINVLRKTGWKRIPVLPVTVALTESTLGDGAYLNAAGNVYELLTEKSGQIEADIKFSVLVNKNAGISSVTFDRVVPGSSVLDLTVEGDKVDVKVAGAQSLTATASSAKAAGTQPTTGPSGASTHVAAAVPAAQAISINWERAIPKIPAAPTKLYAETKTLVAVAEGVLVCQEVVDFNILYTAVRELHLAVPKDVSVLDVVGPNLQDWRVEKDGKLLVVLRSEAIGPYNLRISYETPASATPEVPVIRPVGVESNEKGFVGVIALANVEIGAGKVEGATAVDVKMLPVDISAMTKAPILLGFRYIGDKFSIPLSIKKHGEVNVLVTIVDSALLTTMQLDDGRRMTRVIYTVRNNRNQFLRVQMPAGAEIWSAAVSGSMATPASDEKKNVLIPLIRSAGTAELSSFPVELVYVETPAKPAPPAGTLRVAIPKLDSPVLHVMVNYYAPGEGQYGKPGGWFSAGQSGFSGTLRLVDNFAAMSTDKSVAVVAGNPQKQAQAMQSQFEAKTESEAKAAGVTPIRVRLPIEGRLFKLEKILALPGDDLCFDVEYSNWKSAK